MKEFLISKGWVYVSTCGCTPKLDTYTNPAYPGYEFLLGSQHFNLKKRNQVGVRNNVASGTADTIEVIYNLNLNQ